MIKDGFKKVSIDIEIEVYNKFKDMVKEEDSSMAQTIRKMVKEYVKEQEALR